MKLIVLTFIFFILGTSVGMLVNMDDGKKLKEAYSQGCQDILQGVLEDVGVTVEKAELKELCDTKAQKYQVK